MSDFWKSVDRDDDKQDNSLNLDNLGAEENLPAVPDFGAEPEEAVFEEIEQPSSSEISLGDVEEAQIESNFTSPAKAEIATASKRKPLLLGFIIAIVAVVALVAISSSKPADKAPPPSPAPIASTDIDPIKNPNKEPKIDATDIDNTDIDTNDIGATKPKAPQTSSDGLPTAAEQAKATALLDKVEKWVKEADHPADGKTGKLRNKEEEMAALASKETGVNVISGTKPKLGQVRLTLNRRVGICILRTPVTKKGFTEVRSVKIYTTGLEAR